MYSNTMIIHLILFSFIKTSYDNGMEVDPLHNIWGCRGCMEGRGGGTYNDPTSSYYLHTRPELPHTNKEIGEKSLPTYTDCKFLVEWSLIFRKSI